MDMWEITVEHKGLGKYRVIRGRDKYVVETKAKEQQQIWDNMWLKKTTTHNGEEKAKRLTAEDEKVFNSVKFFLKNTLQKNYVVTSDNYKKQQFSISRPELVQISKAPEPSINKYLRPNINWGWYIVGGFFIFLFLTIVWKDIVLMLGVDEGNAPALSFISTILLLTYIRKKSIKKQKELSLEKYKLEHAAWEEKCKKIDVANIRHKEEHEKALKIWHDQKETFEKEQKVKKSEIDNLFAQYEEGKIEGVEYYASRILEKLPILHFYEQRFDVSYNEQNNILIINYFLPDFELLTEIKKEYKYIKSKNAIQEKKYPEKVLQELYDNLIYQIIFSVIYALFSGDYKQQFDALVVNGYLNAIDKSLGKESTICLTSLQINRKEFEDLNLEMIDPKQCFKRLKGIAGIQLDTKTAIKPIMFLNKEDRRFIESYNVAENIDVGTNLAAIDWQDFENLIRELFEKKFSAHGGECKVTQASRDGGVDAIAFDPDPILGGKIIIQAKRYTNVVGVSAVRDLYGTLINEGASKGILITTSDYGSDAHNFAKGKPIVLLNGNNLLHLLNEFNIKAYINIKEAKQLLKK